MLKLSIGVYLFVLGRPSTIDGRPLSFLGVRGFGLPPGSISAIKMGSTHACS